MKNEIIGYDVSDTSKKYYFKKAISLFLSFAMLFSITAGLDLSVYAASSSTSDNYSMPYQPTSAEDAKYLNTYVEVNDSPQTMYNPYTASMALDMSNVAYKISTDDTWSNALTKYGYTDI